MSARYQAIFGEYLRRVLPGEHSHELARELMLFRTKEREVEAREKGYREDDMSAAHEHEFDPDFDSAASMLNDLARTAVRNLVERKIRAEVARGGDSSRAYVGTGDAAGMAVEDEAQSGGMKKGDEDPEFQVSDREREQKQYRESMRVGDVGEVGMVSEYGVLTSERKDRDEDDKAAVETRDDHESLHEQTMSVDEGDPHDKLHADTMRMDSPEADTLNRDDPERSREKESDMSFGDPAKLFL